MGRTTTQGGRMDDQSTGRDGEATERAEEDEQSRTSGGLPDADEMDQSEIDAIEQERQERLDPENRPANVEVDNTDRTFDEEAGRFTDTEGYDESDKPFAGAEE